MSRAGHSSAACAPAENAAAAASNPKAANAVGRKFSRNCMLFLPSVCFLFLWLRPWAIGTGPRQQFFRPGPVHGTVVPRRSVRDVLPCVMKLAQAPESG